MGFALASAFLDKAYRVTVWNRTINKADPLVSKGAIVADSPASCAQSGTTVIISLVSDDVVRDVLCKTFTLSGRTVVNLTTSRPREIQETADMSINRLGAAGYLHGCILSMPSQVASQQATIIYCGPQPLFAKSKQIYESLGTAKWLSDDLQQISLMENASISMVAGVFAAFFQSLALAGVGGIDVVSFTTQVILPQLQLFQELLPRLARQDQERSHSMCQDGISVETALALVSNACETAETSGVSIRLLQGLQCLLMEGTKLGKGSEDLSSIIEMLRGPH
ncbi:hypothetical protein Asppvi_007036 [Aspergillus pseudoviridinutans]|uniref:6-phosphogluconate dehydrogenase NADP-binding domain-containing protein n=1 Tax=Aspergillus pseudoviridinutans TaxID=1517512 RepID=A0A9P3EU59_9EURO|nr:uncharacterized protein Asppvi_007036 [Aspergillus pseudoviridinutans]GIJ88119.1 hypothetical protein Asppvi_007036 [Aspergillus pseudoviridinutans]